MSQKVAVVTGSNKGVGFAIVKALCQKFDGVVYLTSRDESRGKAAVEELNKIGLKPAYHQLEVNDRDSVTRFRDHIKKTHGGLDILINNAAVVTGLLTKSSYEDHKNLMDINYYSILIIQELLFPLVRDNGRVLNISSDLGHLSNLKNKYWVEKLSRKDLTVDDVNGFVSWYLESDKNGTFNKDDISHNAFLAAYKVSKMALCVLTVIQQRELESRNISVNSMHPGGVETDMIKGAFKTDGKLPEGIKLYTIDEAAVVPVSLVLDPKHQDLRGAYVWHDGTIVDWYDHEKDLFGKAKEALDKLKIDK